MSTFSKFSTGFDVGVFMLEAEFSDEDRQCAWELYTELATRVALVGKRHDDTCTIFDGEIYKESFDSMYHFFREARGIMRRFPVGKLGGRQQDHLGNLIFCLLNDLIRPFLEAWQGPYRQWWEKNAAAGLPFDQESFPQLTTMLADWTKVRLALRGVAEKVRAVYQLTPVPLAVDPE